MHGLLLLLLLLRVLNTTGPGIHVHYSNLYTPHAA